MCSKNFIKRIVPFFLTFAVGLFIASFFITIAAPRFRFSLCGGERFRREQHLQQDRLIQMEVERLRDENSRLEKQLTDKADASNLLLEEDAVPAPPLLPVPPSAPVKVFRK